MEKIKTQKIIKWILPQDTQMKKINMGIVKQPKYLKFNNVC
jgi:hypothetical protein